MTSLVKDLQQPQGIQKEQQYEAVVVQNNDKEKHPDKRMLARIQARPLSLFDGIPDEDLPWAIPSVGNHPEGASAESGSFDVPSIGSKVLISFQNASPMHPIYKPYMMDDQTSLKEREYNYPNRTINLLKNGTMVIVDKQENHIMVRAVGQLDLYVVGNVNLKIEGDFLEKITGNKVSVVEGNSTTIVKGNRAVFVDGSDTQVAGGNVIRVGSRIDDNPGSHPSAPAIPTIPKWKVVRGKKPDSDDLEPSE
jgi:hypothetical protein